MFARHQHEREKNPHRDRRGRVDDVRRVDGVDRLWKPDHMGWVVDISPEHVQAELDRKQRVVPAARRRCDVLWLVLVHNLTRGAPCELSDEAASANYTSGFDRVLWMDPHEPRTRDLRVSAG